MPWPGVDEISDSEGRGVGGTRQNNHIGWKARQRFTEAASSSSSKVAGRSPLAKLAKGDSNSSQKGLRPHEVPYTSNAGGSAAASSSRKTAGAQEDKGVTLRCGQPGRKEEDP